MNAPDIHKAVQMLNDLIQINNDRIAGYEKALEGLSPTDGIELKPFFSQMINNSLDYNESLKRIIGRLDGAPAVGTSGAGKVYRAWMDFKTMVTGGDKAVLLESCETGEQAALRGYDDALADLELDQTTREIVAAQRADIEQALEDLTVLQQGLP